MKKIAILASGSGSNAENITRFFNEGNRLRVELLLVDRKSAPVIERMAPYGVETIWFPRDTWRNNPIPVIDLLKSRDIELVVLAGFNTILPPAFVDAFPNRILNIHPSLLPEFGGEGMWGGNVHKAVLEAGKDRSGATVHYVSNEVDRGEILMQQEVEVFPEDTPESLEQRVHQAEYTLYPRAIVEALRRLDQPQSPDSAWARKLHIPEPPVAPTPPPMPQSEVTIPTPDTTQHLNNPTPFPPQPAPSPTPHIETPNWESNNNAEVPPMPPTYLVWSILCTLACCFIPGIIAVLFSSKVSSQYFAGDYEGAQKSSRQAEIWIIVSFCLGVLSATVYMPLSMMMGG